jgi:hypothetical protein
MTQIWQQTGNILNKKTPIFSTIVRAKIFFLNHNIDPRFVNSAFEIRDQLKRKLGAIFL